MPLRRTATPVLLALPQSLPKIFEQAQVSSANHQKNYVALNKLHNAAADVTEHLQNGIEISLTGERLFEDLFLDMLYRILPLKKGATVVDRIVKFIAGYIKFIKEKDSTRDGDEETDDETTASRFIGGLVRCLIKGFVAKDKNVRYRVLQIVAEILSAQETIDYEVCELLREPLTERLHDKEAPIRQQAIIALSKLLKSDAANKSKSRLLDICLDTLVRDPSADVRKSTLLSIPVTPKTLPTILTRTRDVDTSVRKLAYAPVLEQAENLELSEEQREQICRSGLHDREPSVRAAAVKLIGSWLDGLNGDLERFVRLFKFVNLDHAEDPATMALSSLFESRPEIKGSAEFSDAYWQNINAEKVFIARIFTDHYIDIKEEAKIESSMPVMTALAYKIQAVYSDLLNDTNVAEEKKFFEGGTQPDDSKNKEFMLGELMKIAANMDFADEIGRRKTFALVRNMISQDALPSSLVPLCLDILRKLSSGERDLIRIVVEVIHELRDVDLNEDDFRERSFADIEETPMPGKTPGRPRKPPTEMTEEEKRKADAIDIRCLDLCRGMLERVNSSFEENSTLEGVLGELIIPAVRKNDLELRERGLICLGLCCLIARRMALGSFQLFLKQIQQSPEELKIRVLYVVFDVMMVHEGDFLGNPAVGGDRVIEFLTRIFETDESEKVQAVICTGLSKLMLSGMISDESVLKSLVLAYLSPATVDNHELRQCLSYFFPVYCYSSSSNQRRMQNNFMSLYEELSIIYSELDDDEEMVSPLQAASLIADWTDPQKTIQIPGQEVDMNIHLDMAVDILRTILEKNLKRDDKKVFCQLLNKLYIPDQIDDDKLRTLKLLVNNVRTRRPMKDATSSSALTRFDNAITKKYQSQLEGFNEEEYRQLEYFRDLFEFLDDVMPEEDEDDEPSARRARKRRSESIVTTTTEMTGADEDDYRGTPEPRPKGRRKAEAKKKRRISDSGDDASETEDAPTAPKRTLPKRNARNVAPIIDIPPESDSDRNNSLSELSEAEDEPESRHATPPRTHANAIPQRTPKSWRRIPRGGEKDDDLSSIMNTTTVIEDAEGDDSEVDDLLCEM